MKRFAHVVVVVVVVVDHHAVVVVVPSPRLVNGLPFVGFLVWILTRFFFPSLVYVHIITEGFGVPSPTIRNQGHQAKGAGSHAPEQGGANS